MATQMVTKLVDDLDGGVADRTVTFAWEGQNYEIDLSRKNVAAFENAVKPFVAAARKVRGTRPTAKRGSSRRRPGSPDIREWARANGYEVSDRGRIPAAVVEAYQAQ